MHEIMRTVLEFAKNSPDPSTQNAAAVVDPITMQILTLDCNRFPTNVVYSPERWVRPSKYYFVEHAERNAIYAAARMGIKTEGKILVCPWLACADCARGIIQAGISHLVTLKREITTQHGAWVETVLAGDKMFEEAGIPIEFIDGSFGVELRRNEKLTMF